MLEVLPKEEIERKGWMKEGEEWSDEVSQFDIGTSFLHGFSRKSTGRSG